MKKLNFYLICFFILITLANQGQSSWTRLTPTPQESTINCITKIPGTDKLMATGWGSLMMISEDAGESWDINYNPAGIENGFFGQCIYFLNSNVGFIGGSGLTILKTTDSGSNWYEVYNSGVGNWDCFKDIAFCNETTGFAVGDFSRIKKTTDGGETWVTVEAGNDFNLYKVEFCNETTGFITGSSDEYILKTTDGGNNWQIINLPPGLENLYIQDIHFINETIGFVFCDLGSGTGVIARTTDSGETWNIVNSGLYLSSGTIDFFDEQHGIIGTQGSMYSGYILLTENGGDNWTEIELPSFSWFGAKSVCFLNENNVFSVGNMGMIFKSSDGGLNWQSKLERTFWGDIYEVQFINAQTGYALAESKQGGMLYSDFKKTTDGGNTWTNMGGVWNDNGAFYFVNPDTGFLTAVDFGLQVYKTTDAAENWTQIETGFDFEPQAIKFYGENLGLIVGEWQIIKTTDSGNTWEGVNYSPTFWPVFYDIEYISDEEIFIAGTDENYYTTAVYKSNDGGNTWEMDSIGNFGAATDIYFVNNDTAFLVCEGNAILKSDDGGETWFETTLNNLNPISFKSIHFPSANTGYAVGSGTYETIVKTTDGGETWNAINSVSSSGLLDLHFFDDLNGLVFGGNGLVMKTTTGGTTGFETNRIASGNYNVFISPNPCSDNICVSFNASESEQP
ncbi:MAG: hypothetical protein B6D61_09945, partial [Bacteroidetes bacterium 4484_249]